MYRMLFWIEWHTGLLEQHCQKDFTTKGINSHSAGPGLSWKSCLDLESTRSRIDHDSCDGQFSCGFSETLHLAGATLSCIGSTCQYLHAQGSVYRRAEEQHTRLFSKSSHATAERQIVLSAAGSYKNVGMK
eukprot:4898532-Amphidinium_carterae.1